MPTASPRALRRSLKDILGYTVARHAWLSLLELLFVMAMVAILGTLAFDSKLQIRLKYSLDDIVRVRDGAFVAGSP